MSTVPSSFPTSQVGDPPWEIARFFPPQGGWSEDEYLDFNTNRGIEFVEGCLEFLPMLTKLHQLIVGYLYRTFFAHVAAANLGTVLLSGYRIKVAEKKYREPDVVVILTKNEAAAGQQFAKTVDVAVEVVSPDAPDRDVKTKRDEYAAAGIAEYWIVDPRNATVTVLTLPEGTSEYAEAGKYSRGQKANSVLLEGFAVDVDEMFSQG